MMRGPTLLSILLLLVAGCTSAPSENTEGQARHISDPEPTPGGSSGDDQVIAEAPELVPGTTWTYATSGYWDTGLEETVVYAGIQNGVHLFAATERDHLQQAAVWNADWFGGRTDDWHGDGAYLPANRQLFDFPLEDGKTWDTGENGKATAYLEEVPVPGGRETGFRIEVISHERVWLTYTYAPSVGYLTSYEWHGPEGPYERIDLLRMGTTSSWIGYEKGDFTWIEDGDAAGATPLQVDAGWDALAISAGGRVDGHVVVQAPPTASAAEPLVYAFEEAGETWTYELVDVPEGAWSMTAASGQEGWAFVGAVPVRWVEGTIS